MFGKIVYISDSVAHISIPDGTPVTMDLMNMHVVFEDAERKVLGEVVDVSESIIKVNFLGVIENGRFIGGVLRKPTLEANIRIVTEEELNLITGVEGEGMFKLGASPLYGDKSNLAKTLIFAGTNEIFYKDIKEYVENCDNVRLVTGESLFHIYPLFPIPEAKKAFKEIKKEIID